MKVGVVLPIYNNRDNTIKNLENLVESLICLRKIDNLVFLVNFQNFNDEELDYCLLLLEDAILKNNSTWELNYVINSYEKPISMVVIRNDCMKLDLSLPLYMFIDDDFKFNGGADDCYLEIIENYKINPKLGMVMSAGFLGGYNYKNIIKPDISKHWWTNRGLFIKNLKRPNSPIYSDNALNYHKGGCEEFVVAMECLKDRLILGTHFNNPTHHKATGVDDSMYKKRKEDDVIHDIDLLCAGFRDYLNHEFNLNQDMPKSIKDIRDLLNTISWVYK